MTDGRTGNSMNHLYSRTELLSMRPRPLLDGGGTVRIMRIERDYDMCIRRASEERRSTFVLHNLASLDGIPVLGLQCRWSGASADGWRMNGLASFSYGSAVLTCNSLTAFFSAALSLRSQIGSLPYRYMAVSRLSEEMMTTLVTALSDWNGAILVFN